MTINYAEGDGQMVNVQSATSAAPFSGAAEALQTLETPAINTSMPEAPSIEPIEVQVSQQSLEISAPPAPPAAANSFAQAGSRQYEVFNNYMQQNGVMDAEPLLKQITSAMDSIAPGSRSSISENAPTQSAAEMALASSEAALEKMATRLPEKAQEGFQKLIDQYKSYNEGVVAKHQNIYDYREMALAHAGDPLPAYSEGKQRVEQSDIMRRLGNITPTPEEKQEIAKTYASLFAAAKKTGADIPTLFRRLQTAYVNYASGGSRDAAVREALTKRTETTMDQMKSYWNQLQKGAATEKTGALAAQV